MAAPGQGQHARGFFLTCNTKMDTKREKRQKGAGTARSMRDGKVYPAAAKTPAAGHQMEMAGYSAATQEGGAA